MRKVISEEVLNLVRKDGVVCLVDAGYGAYSMYEEICNMFGTIPLERYSDNDDWIEDYVEKRDSLESRLVLELPQDIVFWFNEDGDMLISTYAEYAISNQYNDDILDIIQNLEDDIENVIDSRKRFEFEDAVNGNYSDFFSGALPDDYEIVVYDDFYNHANEYTLDSCAIFNGEIEIEINKDRFSFKERTILELILQGKVKSHLVVHDNDDSILVYDTFYLYQYAQNR